MGISFIVRALLLAAPASQAFADEAPTASTGVTAEANAQAQILGGATLKDGRVTPTDPQRRADAHPAFISLTSASDHRCDGDAPPDCRLTVIDLP